MRVGVPKEIKVHEYRVGLTPSSVRELAAGGHDVLIETAAGCGSLTFTISSARAKTSAASATIVAPARA